MTTMDILTAMKPLNLPNGSYVVFGSGPLAAAGIREVNDIDLLISTELKVKLKKSGWKEITKGPIDTPITHGDIEAHDHWNFSSYSPTLSELLSRAFFINDVPFASLEDVRKWKEATGGPKHNHDIELIDSYLAELDAKIK